MIAASPTVWDRYFELLAERAALRIQLEATTQLWLAAEADADHWYFEANNPAEARERRAQLADTTCIDVVENRAATDQRWAAMDAAGRQAS